MPDLKIIDVYVNYNAWGFPDCIASLHNYGNASIANAKINCSLTIKRLFTNKILCSYTTYNYFTEKYPLNPGETKNIWIGDLCVCDMPFRFKGYISLNVDSNNEIIESDENNNIVWATIEGYVSFCSDYMCNCNFDIGILHWSSNKSKYIGDFYISFFYNFPLLTQNNRNILPLEFKNHTKFNKLDLSS